MTKDVLDGSLTNLFFFCLLIIILLKGQKPKHKTKAEKKGSKHKLKSKGPHTGPTYKQAQEWPKP